MANTFTSIDRYKFGNANALILDASIDTYATGGIGIPAAKFGLATISMVIPEAAAGYVAHYDLASKKLLLYIADYDAVADGPLIEVADKAALDPAVSIRLLAIGR